MPRVSDPFILSKSPNLLNLAWINRRHDLSRWDGTKVSHVRTHRAKQSPGGKAITLSSLRLARLVGLLLEPRTCRRTVDTRSFCNAIKPSSASPNWCSPSYHVGHGASCRERLWLIPGYVSAESGTFTAITSFLKSAFVLNKVDWKSVC